MMQDTYHAANDCGETPLWFKHSSKLWVQDECAPDAERVDSAWLRIFGEHADRSQAVGYFDGGDTFAWLMPNDRVYGFDFMGGFILRPTIIRVLSGAL